MGMTRKSTLREMEIRTENRYILHPQGKKRCTKCETVYDNIPDNYDIHHRKPNGEYSYAGQCKRCIAKVRRDRVDRYKSDIELYTKRLIPAVRCRANRDGLEFNLTAEYLVKLWQEQDGKCYYTGNSMDLHAANENRRSPHIDFPSIDKLTPSLGYVEGNVVWTLYGVNRMKNNFTKDEFIDFCKLITERFM